jgi:pro-apoptotic serine protease NMA111
MLTSAQNDHYFPMSQYIKDPSKPTGWRVVSYSNKKKEDEGAPVTAESMEEGADDGSGAEEPEHR